MLAVIFVMLSVLIGSALLMTLFMWSFTKLGDFLFNKVSNIWLATFLSLLYLIGFILCLFSVAVLIAES